MNDEKSNETEHVQFTCKRCGKDVDREPHQMDVEGLTPSRCAQCVFELMGAP